MPANLPLSSLSIERIARARSLVEPAFLDTPLREATALTRRLGCTLLLKDETAGPLGCFKGRGADLYVATLTGAPLAGLVCASAGNFGLALADAGRRRGVPVTVFVSLHASELKVARIRACGAQVFVCGEDFDAAKAAARSHAQRTGAHWVEDGAEPAISEGAGTIAMELGQDIDAILVPVGNGALAAGIGTWLKAHLPRVRVVGVCSRHAPVMHACWHRGLAAAREDARADTIADGIAVRVPVAAAVAELARVLDDFVMVEDEALLAAMRTLHADGGIAAEPSAVAGIAAIGADRSRWAGLRVATVLTGANLTDPQRSSWLAGP